MTNSPNKYWQHNTFQQDLEKHITTETPLLPTVKEVVIEATKEEVAVLEVSAPIESKKAKQKYTKRSHNKNKGK